MVRDTRSLALFVLGRAGYGVEWILGSSLSACLCHTQANYGDLWFIMVVEQVATRDLQ
jgi:hypothetical protein